VAFALGLFHVGLDGAPGLAVGPVDERDRGLAHLAPALHEVNGHGFEVVGCGSLALLVSLSVAPERRAIGGRGPLRSQERPSVSDGRSALASRVSGGLGAVRREADDVTVPWLA